MRLRFAPSPTGHLHVGNARTALFNWLLARGRGGTFIVRIEDTDRERSTVESERGILDDLQWLGLGWDEGPDVGGPYGPYRQSERAALYHAHAQRLLRQGDAYYCFCSPAQLEQDREVALAAGEQPKYVGRCRNLDPIASRTRVAAGEPAAIRFQVPPGPEVAFVDQVRGEVRFSRPLIGDPVILRSDGHPAYNFAVVVDDALMKVTDVIRGEDHISNTPRQLLLYDALRYPAPQFAHLSLVLGPDHSPLSKRHGATSVAEFRARGILPEALVNYLALIGWSPGGDEEIVPLHEMAHRFAIADVGKTAGVFDPEKLAWINRHYIRSADRDRLVSALEPFLAAAGFVRELDPRGRAYVAECVVPLAARAIDRLDEAAARVEFLFAYDAAASVSDRAVRDEFADPGSRAVVAALAEYLAAAPRLETREMFREATAELRQRTGQKGRALFHPIRVALTGRPDGPELDLAIPAIDRGAGLPDGAGVASVVGCRERAHAFMEALQHASPQFT
jgi:glutamyl-tRNA synthetase